MVLSEVNAALSLWDRIRKWWSKKDSRQIESVSTRFVRLFETHGVHRNQIPRFFGHNLALKDLQDDQALLLRLEESLLEAACDLFSIRREWLDGADSQIHPCYDFYKKPIEFSIYLDQLIAKNPKTQIIGVLITPENADPHDEALIILQETIGVVGTKEIHRYHICNNWNFTYWRSRAYLAACIALAWKRDIYIHGIYEPKERINQLSQGEAMLGWHGEGIWELGRTSWHPEDMVLEPKVFLEGIDPERKKYGITSALQFWLELEQKGLMDAGFNKDVRELFEKELAKYQH